MKKFVGILCFLLIIILLGNSCASSKKTTNCPAYGKSSSRYERLPY